MERIANKNKVGRPIEKEGRIKIGLSIDAESNIILDSLAKRTGKTKSRLFEDAIKLVKKREDEIYKRMLEYEKYGDGVLVSKEEALAGLKKGF